MKTLITSLFSLGVDSVDNSSYDICQRISSNKEPYHSIYANLSNVGLICSSGIEHLLIYPILELSFDPLLCRKRKFIYLLMHHMG